MHHLENEQDIKSYVKYLKNFYGELSVYILVITISLIIWLLMGGGYFWPLWIILIWGIVLLLKASRLRVVSPMLYEAAHRFREKLPFIRPQWQEEKVQEILKKMGRTLSVAGSTSPKKKAATPVKKSPPKKAHKKAKKK